LALNYFFYSGKTQLANQLSFLYIYANKKNILFKKNFNIKMNNFNSNYYVVNSNFNSTNNYILNILKYDGKFLKRNFFFLLESNLTEPNPSKSWDFILPLTILTENFLQFKMLTSFTAKSLFIKLGPWCARNLFSYLNFFLLIDKFPYLWLNKNLQFFFEVDVLFFNFWLKGYLNLKLKKRKGAISRISKISFFNKSLRLPLFQYSKFLSFSN